MSSKVLFGVAAALALASFLAVRGEVARAARAQRRGRPGGRPSSLRRTTCSPGATIGPGDVRLAQIPVVYLPPHAVTSTAAAIGKVSASAILGGEVLVDARLGTSTVRRLGRAGRRRGHGRVRHRSPTA